jgi:2-ketocyclohexanecarboxyl-CoA hydrolase
MLRRLSAEEALDWGLVNKVVPAADLKDEVRTWADTMNSYSPTALKVLKQSFNSDTEHFVAVGNMAITTLKLFGETPEAHEGITAFNEKRQPDFSKYRGN